MRQPDMMNRLDRLRAPMTRTRASRPVRSSSRQEPAPSADKSTPNRLRIIGGRWRGVPITFPPVAALRPSPDRVRETLFNWLQPLIADARCLDLFAGSGALGIEALSRGEELRRVDPGRDDHAELRGVERGEDQHA